MLNITKKVSIVASLVTIYSGQFYAFGTYNNPMEESADNTQKSQVAVVHYNNARNLNPQTFYQKTV